MEYPSAINICNISNETLVGKVFLEEPDDLNIPIPEGFVFKGNEEEGYKLDKGNYLLEIYSERDVLNFGTLFLDLPSADEVLDGISEII